MTSRKRQDTGNRKWNHCVAQYVKLALVEVMYRGAYKSLARPGRKQATATEEFDVHISYL